MNTEPELLYRTLFGTLCPPVVAERFTAAGDVLERSAAPAECTAYHRALASGLDLEALELAGRYTHRLPLLSRKLHLMAYIAETVPANQRRYINRHGGLLSGMIHLSAAVARTVIKMVAGLWWIRRVQT